MAVASTLGTWMRLVVTVGLMVGAWAVCGCASGPGPTSRPASGLTEVQARDLAQREAARQGYGPAEYEVRSSERQADGTYVVFLHHRPPEPPGAHCMVYVSPDGTTRLVHGE